MTYISDELAALRAENEAMRLELADIHRWEDGYRAWVEEYRAWRDQYLAAPAVSGEPMPPDDAPDPPVPLRKRHLDTTPDIGVHAIISEPIVKP